MSGVEGTRNARVGNARAPRTTASTKPLAQENRDGCAQRTARCPPKGRGLAVAGERRGAADTCAAARHQREPTGDPRHLGRVPEGVALSEIEQHARSPCRSGVGRKLHPLGRRALGIDQDGGVPREIAIRKRSMVAHSRDAAVADGIDDERFDAFSGSPPAPTTRILYRSCCGGSPRRSFAAEVTVYPGRIPAREPWPVGRCQLPTERPVRWADLLNRASSS